MPKQLSALLSTLATFLLILTWQLSALAQGTPNAIVANQPLKILAVTAHPDDETGFAVTIYKLSHDLKSRVDIAVVTNGEGGYKYSTLAEDLYGVELTDEKVGREYLPTIRKRELMAAGKLLGIRNYFFLEQKDHRYTQDVKEVFQGVWDTELVKKRLKDIIQLGAYDYIIVLLPTADTHGHHKGATILALEAVKELALAKKPTILGAQLVSKDDMTSYTELADFPLTKVKADTPVFVFDRNQKIGYKDALTYKIVANWALAEHKSQGATQMGVNLGDLEKFYFFDINNKEMIEPTINLFKQLKIVSFKPREY